MGLTRNSIKQYRSEVLPEESNTAGPSNAREVHEINESAKANSCNITFTMTKNQKEYTIKGSSSCLVMPHTPKMQSADRKMIMESCLLGIGSLVNDPKYCNSEEMKEFKYNQNMQQKITLYRESVVFVVEQRLIITDIE